MASLQKLHYKHLPPSYTDLFTAQLLANLGKDELAKSLTLPAFNYYYQNVTDQLKRNELPDDIDLYVLRQSTGLLSQLGDKQSVLKFEQLGL